MKVFLSMVILAVFLVASEPIQYGSYYGDFKFKTHNLRSYPQNDGSSAGLLYLYKKNKSVLTYVYETKLAQIKKGLEEAKEYAKKHKLKYYAIDHITHQVLITENQVIVLTNYNILAFD